MSHSLSVLTDFLFHFPHCGHGSEETLQDFSPGVEPVDGVWLFQFLYKFHIYVALGFSLSVKFGNSFPSCCGLHGAPWGGGDVGGLAAGKPWVPGITESLLTASDFLLWFRCWHGGVQEKSHKDVK